MNLFSILCSSSSMSVDASSFGCAVILSLYLTLNFVIYSLITLQSVHNTLLDMCYGALHGGLYFVISVILQCFNY
jgi:hypothetical protein